MNISLNSASFILLHAFRFGIVLIRAAFGEQSVHIASLHKSLIQSPRIRYITMQRNSLRLDGSEISANGREAHGFLKTARDR